MLDRKTVQRVGCIRVASLGEMKKETPNERLP